MSEDTKTFEGWAILELMGHRRLAGHVSEVQIAGAGFIRLDIPEAQEDGETYPAMTQFYSPASVYALTPATEETARSVRSRPEPVHSFEVARRPALPVGGGDDERADYMGDDVIDHDADDDEPF